ncbi:MAG: LON peptidase substrate-binding domain-containing protein [Chloroflexi bacterium]|nr:LON peptidase substrate-binding domain-containing protein [Chloroflexota bacterium]
MPSEARQLPIFPLNTVLFPGASLPLQIFEERYKLMMEHCLEGDSKFGVVLIQSGSEVGEPAVPHQTGTLAEIVQVNRVRGDRMFISVTGQQRFRIREITQRRPYIAAEVELFEDEADPPVPPSEMEAVRDAVTVYHRLLLGLRGGWVRETRMPSDPVALGYFIAGLLQIGSKEKQELLEEPSASRRLEAELDLLRREAEGLGQRVAAELRKSFSRQ